MRQRHANGLAITAILMASVVSGFTPTALAQGLDTALLRGTVTDVTGAVVPNAMVTMTNVAVG